MAAEAASGAACETTDAQRLGGPAGIRAEMAGIYGDARSGKLDDISTVGRRPW